MRITLLSFGTLPNSQTPSSANKTSFAEETVYHVPRIIATVATLKQIIEATKSVSTDEQRLLMSGMTLNDSTK